MAAMWVTENLFLVIVALINVWQLFAFCQHVFIYREFVKVQLLDHRK